MRAALAASVAWALAVWWFGEGLGGVLSGMASPLTGAPGAVILYALLAVLAWPMAGADGSGRRDTGRSPQAARWAWPGPGSPGWSCGAVSPISSCRPRTGRPARSRDTFAGLAAGEPGWIAAMDRGIASAAGGHGLAISIGLAVVFVAAGLGVFWPATTRAALLLSVIAALAIWVLGENFGELATGQGTDPNSGLLLVVLAAAFWPLAAAGPSRFRS